MQDVGGVDLASGEVGGGVATAAIASCVEVPTGTPARRPRRTGRRRWGGPARRRVRPATTRVISPRADAAAQASSARGRGGPPRRSWSAPGTAPPAGRRRRPRPGRRRVSRRGAGTRRRRGSVSSAASAAKPGAALALLAGQEPLEAEPVAGQAGQGQGGRDGTRAGRDGDRYPASSAARTSRKPGSDTLGMPPSVTRATRRPGPSSRRPARECGAPRCPRSS